jgi:phosphosulfolactate synthase (CoM biosynthesis protein A)
MQKLGFDIVEISAGFVSLPTDDWLRLIDLVRKSGMKAKPEVGIQFGAGARRLLRSWRPKVHGIRAGQSRKRNDFLMQALRSS